MFSKKLNFVFVQIIVITCLFKEIKCQSEENISVSDVEDVENGNMDLSTPPISETEKVTEAESVVDLAEPLSSTPSLVTEETVIAKASTHTTPIKVATEFSKEQAPTNMIAIWNDEGKICLLAKLSARFSITYSGTDQPLIVDLPSFAKAKGKCEPITETPSLQLMWDGFTFSMTFSKQENDDEDWVVTSMELRYDTSMPIFDGATNVGKKVAKSKPLQLFETSVGKSFSCPSPEVVILFNNANKQVADIRLKDVHLQPFDVKDAKLSPPERCGQVAIDSSDDQFVQDETVPLAVGCTLGLLTLLILIAFSIHRAYTAAKVDYNNME